MSDVIIKELDKAKIMVLSVQGENHKKNGICNQDSYSFKVDDSGNYAFVVADGVSTCKFAKQGADKACETVCNMLSACAELSEEEIKQTVFSAWKKLVGKSWNDYGTTINFLYGYSDRLVMGKVGDGAVLVKNGKNTSFLHEESDFYTSETFALGESIPKEQFRIISMGYEKLQPILIILMTDGIEKELKSEKIADFVSYIDLAIENSNFVVELNDWVVTLNNKNGDDKTILICKIEGR